MSLDQNSETGTAGAEAPGKRDNDDTATLEFSGTPVWTLTDDDVDRLRNIERLPHNSIWHGHDGLKTIARRLSGKLPFFLEHPWLIEPAVPVGLPRPGEFTVLGADKNLNKTIYKFAGRWRKVDEEDGTKAFRHKIALAACHNLEDIATLLRHLEPFSFVCLIRGYPASGPYWKNWHRRKFENGGVFVDVPRSWVCLDVDGYAMPDHLSYDEPAQIVDYLMHEAMPPCFRDVSCTWQISSTGGTVKQRAANFHLFVLLSKPTLTEDIRQFIQTDRETYKAIDPAAIRVVQPTFTARPTIDPRSDTMDDPMKGRRVGVWRGKNDVADLTGVIAAFKEKRAAENAAREVTRQKKVDAAIAVERDPIMKAKLKRDGLPPRTDGKYLRLWNYIANEDMGTANGHGYNGPIYSLLKVAADSGCTDGFAIIEHVQSFVPEVARRHGDYEEYADKFERYLDTDDLRRRLDDAAAGLVVDIVY